MIEEAQNAAVLHYCMISAYLAVPTCKNQIRLGDFWVVSEDGGAGRNLAAPCTRGVSNPSTTSITYCMDHH